MIDELGKERRRGRKFFLTCLDSFNPIVKISSQLKQILKVKNDWVELLLFSSENDKEDFYNIEDRMNLNSKSNSNQVFCRNQQEQKIRSQLSC